MKAVGHSSFSGAGPVSTLILKVDSEQRSAAPSRDGRAFRVVRIVLGLLLVTAAGLKLYGLNVTALPRVGWFVTPQIQVAAAEWELVLGLWLLSGAVQQLAWLTAIGTFSIFAIISAYFGWIGVASCGCFGAIRASPWTAFGVDVAAVIALLIFRPGARSASKGSSFTLARAAGSHAMIPLGAAAILLALTGIGSWVYGSPAAALAHLRGELLTIEPSYVDFGSGKPGDAVKRTVTVYNWSDQPVRLIGGTSDCSCVTTDDLPATIFPNAGTPITVKVFLGGMDSGLVSRTATFSTDADHQRKLAVALTGRILR